MMFFFKKKETVLDCFTYLQSAKDVFHIEKAPRFIPDWFKNLDLANYTDATRPMGGLTMRKCPGFLDYFKNSIGIPMWDFIHVIVPNTAKPDVRCKTAHLHHHEQKQYEGYLDKSYHHFKIEVPWMIKSSTSVPFIQTFPTWCYQTKHMPERILHMPGVLNFKYQYGANFNFFFKRPDTSKDIYTYIFEPGIPLYFLTPLEETKIVIRKHVIERSEFFDKITLAPTVGPGQRQVIQKYIDKNDQFKEKKCPFGFGRKRD